LVAAPPALARGAGGVGAARDGPRARARGRTLGAPRAFAARAPRARTDRRAGRGGKPLVPRPHARGGPRRVRTRANRRSRRSARGDARGSDVRSVTPGRTDTRRGGRPRGGARREGAQPRPRPPPPPPPSPRAR